MRSLILFSNFYFSIITMALPLSAESIFMSSSCLSWWTLCVSALKVIKCDRFYFAECSAYKKQFEQWTYSNECILLNISFSFSIPYTSQCWDCLVKSPPVSPNSCNLPHSCQTVCDRFAQNFLGKLYYFESHN